MNMENYSQKRIDRYMYSCTWSNNFECKPQC